MGRHTFYSCDFYHICDTWMACWDTQMSSFKMSMWYEMAEAAANCTDAGWGQGPRTRLI
jgi:hypothetical protein